MSNLVEKFWEKSGVEYGITIEEFKLICYSPFRYIKKVLANSLMVNIRLFYLGEFRVSGARLGYNKNSLEKNYANGVTSEENYNKRIEILNRYKHVKKDKKNKL